MSFANPWGLLGLLAVPAILVIHLYHQRFPPLVVGGMHLWGAEIETRSAGRRRERLPITATLLLELLAAILLSLALARPVVGGRGGGKHLVVVLDDSASMRAVPEGTQSFRDLALEELERRVADLPRRSVVTVVLSGRRPRTLTEPMSPWADVTEALNGWQPRAARHDFQPAWDLAAQLAEESGSLLFLTDDLPRGLTATSDAASPPSSDETASPDAENVGGLPLGMEVVSVGLPLDNVAIAAAHWKLLPITREVPDALPGSDGTRTEILGYEGSVHLRVTNHGRRDRTVTIRGAKGDEEVFAARVAVSVGASVPFAADVPSGLGTLTVTATADDDPLAIDDEVRLVEPRTRTLKVAVALEDDHPSRKGVQRAFDAVPEVEYVDVDEAALVIAPAAEAPPPVRPDLWWLSMGPIDTAEAARGTAKDLKGPYLIEKRNPLLTDVYLDGVLWAGVQPMEFDVAPLVSAGSLVLVGRRRDTESRAYVVNVDLSQPNLADSRDWPKLASNLAELARDDQPGLRRWNYRLGEAVRLRLYHTLEAGATVGERDVTVTNGDRTRTLPRTAFVETPPLEEPGEYEVRDGDELVGRFSINFFDPVESQLRFLNPGRHIPAEDHATSLFTRDDPYTWLLALALVLTIAALFADWLVLRPRRAPASGGR